MLQEYQSILRKILERVDKKTVDGGGGGGDGGGAHPAPGAAPCARRSRRRAPSWCCAVDLGAGGQQPGAAVPRRRCHGGAARLPCAGACCIQGRAVTSCCVGGCTDFRQSRCDRGSLPCALCAM